jgi:hypothetical protein
MNKRIEELLYETGARYNGYHLTGETRLYTEDVDYEKFAELIVKECSKISEDDVTDGDACCTNTADRIARQIKKHFGVEE